MDVILLEDMDNLGGIGALVKVAPGFARNFLLPKKLARQASKQNKRQLEHDMRVAEYRRAKAQAVAHATLSQLAAIKVEIARKVGEQDKLYGSVTTADIAAALAAQKIDIDKRKIKLHEPIKALGLYDVDIRLQAELSATIKVSVVAEA